MSFSDKNILIFLSLASDEGVHHVCRTGKFKVNSGSYIFSNKIYIFLILFHQVPYKEVVSL